jgi:flagellin-like hook-associated protein FlgL
LNIVSNYAANVAQRYLQRSDADATRSLAKLSSGTRVLSGRDDAASMAIGSTLRGDVAALKTASVNISQAMSMLQVADGGMQTIGDLVTRARVLASQSASGQLTTDERAMIDVEYQQVLKEVDRVGNSTAFNGTKLLSGTGSVKPGTATTQSAYLVDSDSGIQDLDVSGAPAGSLFSLSYNDGTREMTVINLTTGDTQSLVVDENTLNATGAYKTQKMDFTELGVKFNLNDSFTKSTSITGINGETNLRKFGSELRQAATGDSRYTTGDDELKISNIRLRALADYASLAISNTAQSFHLITDSNGDAISVGFSGAATATLSSTGDVNEAAGTLATTVSIKNAAGQDVSLDAVTDSNGNALKSIENLSAGDIVTVVVSDGVWTSARKEYFEISFVIDDVSAAVGASSTAASIVAEVQLNLQATFASIAKPASESAFTFQVGHQTSANDRLTVKMDSVSTGSLGVAASNVLSTESSMAAIDKLVTATDRINTMRAKLGADMNRFEAAGQNVATMTENLEAARSALLDLDVAAEMSNFTAQQILQQAGVSMLAQANQMPQNLMRLFR